MHGPGFESPGGVCEPVGPRGGKRGGKHDQDGRRRELPRKKGDKGGGWAIPSNVFTGV